jgi:hypothetical protein
MEETEKEIELIKEKLELMERLLEVEKELNEIHPQRIVIPNPCPQPIIIPVPDPCPPKPCPRKTTGPIWIQDPYQEPIVTCGSDGVTYHSDSSTLNRSTIKVQIE